MDDTLSKFGIALFGSGSVAGYIIKWGIEKKKMKIEYKQRLIKRWREYIDSYFVQTEFNDTVMYSEMRPHLSERTLNAIEKREIRSRPGRGGNIVKSLVLDDIARLEKEWDLI